MRSFFLKLRDREEGPYADGQIAQMFADQRVNRSTPCKPETGGDWRTIDDYLPTLKYGTQLPSPTVTPARTPPTISAVRRVPADQSVTVVDIDVPFGSLLKLMFKWAGATLIVGISLAPVILVIWFVIALLLAGLIGGALSGLPRP